MKSLIPLLSGVPRMVLLIGISLLLGFSGIGCSISKTDNIPLTREQLVQQTLLINDAERARLNVLADEGLLSVTPIALPFEAHLIGNNRHLGWPVGIKAGNALLCVYHRNLHHHGGGPSTDENSSQAVLTRSEDGGETWSSPVDMRSFGQSKEPVVLGFGNCFGLLNNEVFLASCYGVYRSADEGRTWTFLEGALTHRQTGHAYADSFGPRMVIHPDRGLVIPVGVAREPCLDLYYSRDRGETWTHERIQVSDDIHPLEPTALYHEGRLIFLSRNHTLPFRWHHELDIAQRPVMMVSNSGWFPMDHQGATNISSYRWPDTTDLDYNPVTGRYEAVVTNRSGGVLEHERNERKEQTVNVWSLSKEDLIAGKADTWRFEATLLRFRSGMLDISPKDIDAAHPGGAVMDEARGVQHIFIYCGSYATPAGIYRITRTLDTNRLRARSVTE